MRGPAEARDLQAEVEHERSLALAGRRVERGERLGADERHRAGAAHRDEALARRSAWRRLPSRAVARRRVRGDGRLARAIALAHERGGRFEDDRVGGYRVALGERQPSRAALRVEARAVDDRRQPARQPLGDDELEQFEGVAARALIALAGAYDRARRSEETIWSG